MRKPFLPVVLFAATIAATATYVIAGKALPFVAPHVAVIASRQTYALGEPIPITYRVVNAAAIPVVPMSGCYFGSAPDLSVEMFVRTVGGSPKASHASIGGQTASHALNPFAPSDTVNVNDGISIARPGTYQITVYVYVSRPASDLHDLRSNTVTIHVTDTPAARVKRKAQIASVAEVMRNTAASPRTKASAIATLHYNSEPEALPILLDAFGSPDVGIRKAVHAPLFLWHDPQAVHHAACAWLKSHPYQPGSENGWKELIADSDIRAHSYFCGESFDESEQRAATAVYQWQQR
ncbi:MAG: hypothetical protein H7Y38_08935 [Armatimonadetes bacterium]|nr:hypothetical protein [Armatimonadota bacterium]